MDSETLVIFIPNDVSYDGIDTFHLIPHSFQAHVSHSKTQIIQIYSVNFPGKLLIWKWIATLISYPVRCCGVFCLLPHHGMPTRSITNVFPWSEHIRKFISGTSGKLWLPYFPIYFFGMFTTSSSYDVNRSSFGWSYLSFSANFLLIHTWKPKFMGNVVRTSRSTPFLRKWVRGKS